MTNPNIIQDDQITVGGNAIPADQTLRPTGRVPGMSNLNSLLYHPVYKFMMAG